MLESIVSGELIGGYIQSGVRRRHRLVNAIYKRGKEDFVSCYVISCSFTKGA